MSKTIWVVMSHASEQYEDTFTSAVRAFHSEDRAEEYAKILNEERRQEENLIDKWREEDHECLEDLDVSYENSDGTVDWFKDCSDKCIRCKVDEGRMHYWYNCTKIELEVE